ncbi:MAG: glutamine synthetase family protein [Pseudomonadales bacterium]|nr:glutamine synthetase family protein [Pseudomonadales bacterium]
MELHELREWLDRHHVEIIRTYATTLDGPGVGKYLQRDKFFQSLAGGHAITDIALNMDINGMPHMSIWHPQRQPNFGDICLQPDINTLISDGNDPDLGHIICDFTDVAGTPLQLCPRSTLKRMVSQVAQLGYGIKAAVELEFFLFEDSYKDLHRDNYKYLNPVSASKKGGIYSIRNAHLVAPFMRQVTKRLNWQGIQWEAWNDEAGVGQIELNLSPTDPLQMADNVVRSKQILYEIAVDMGMAVTFMAKATPGYSSGMHVHHSLFSLQTKNNVFFSAQMPHNRSSIMLQWLAGIMATLHGAVSYLCPTINSYRRFSQYAAAPMTATWGEDNKSTAIRTISTNDSSCRIEHRLPAGDCNPYLALAIILAGGLAGIKHQLSPPEEFTRLAWGLPASELDLPTNISSASKCLLADDLLQQILGEDITQYWAKTRAAEWLAFNAEAEQTNSKTITLWEFERYFEMI